MIFKSGNQSNALNRIYNKKTPKVKKFRKSPLFRLTESHFSCTAFYSMLGVIWAFCGLFAQVLDIENKNEMGNQ
jgi:hypothetical protein